MVNIFSGVTPGAELLGAHERLTEQGNLQRQHHELYFFATGSKAAKQLQAAHQKHLEKYRALAK